MLFTVVFFFSEMALQKISESIYVALCLKLGTSQQVAIRRDLVDIKESLENKVARTDLVIMQSGSSREGFRLNDSDVDTMIWPNNHRVLWDFSQAQFYNTRRQSLILCDSSESPPGFTLLWLPLEEAGCDVLSSCVILNGSLYLSSAEYRNNINYCTAYEMAETKVHGPCSSGTYFGELEYDNAHCLVSDFWPPSASSWIDRCHSWPPYHVVEDIVRSGCHLLAIGHKLGKHVDNEWRISFSQAEQKLVYTMNHTQFLTYGLLKLFLKEIINNGLAEEEKLLCSYHMKTAIFWAIQQKTIVHWCPENLLEGFWVCFKLLLKWVYEGVCPNFFIPENNMFLCNVHGEAQATLFTRLFGLYEKGIALLLQSPSINTDIMYALCNPSLSICISDRTLISEAVLDVGLFNEILINETLAFSTLNKCFECLRTVENLLRSPLTQCQVIMLQKLTATILQRSAFILHDMNTKTARVNKHIYISDRISCYMLKLAAKFGYVSDLLYFAIYYYKTFRYREALSVLEITKVKFAQPGLMLFGTHVDPESYITAFGGHSWSNKMRHGVASIIKLDSNICFIKELTPEQQSGLQNRSPALYIPPYILLHMLEFLCCRCVDPMRADLVLDKLQDLVHDDRGVFVPVLFRDISWEILGICQQMTGNHQAAMYSYQQSLRQFPMHKIHIATRQRIQDLH